MKFIATSDWHVRGTTPKHRIDEYGDSILNKIGWIVRKANKLNVPILVAGDIFHNIRVGLRSINRLIIILKKCKHGVFCVPGQHDKEHHANDMIPTPYFTLIKCEAITDLGKVPVNNIYGIGWGDDPIIETAPNNSIVVTHFCTTPENPPFFLEDNALSAEDVLNSFSDFKIVITGDYHIPHVLKKDGRLLVNPGCIGRSSKDQVDFQPVVYLVDTEKVTAQEIKIPIRPSEEVFKIPENEDELDKEFSKHIQEIIDSSKNTEEKPDFITTVRRIMTKGNYTDRQKEIAEKFYNECREI